MIQQSTERGLAKQAWPLDGLEPVTACPVCGAAGAQWSEAKSRAPLHNDLADRVFFCAPGVWTLYRCNRCSSAYLNPRPTPETIHLAYTSYYTHVTSPSMGEASEMASRRMRLAFGYLNLRYGYALKPASNLGFLLAWFLPFRRAKQDKSVRHLRRPAGAGRLLDIGCGNGDFLAWMRQLGWNVEGVDPDPVAVASARAAGLPVQEGTLSTVRFPDDSFDAVTMSHVIEHLHDPLGTLRECYRILRPGGVLWVATPNLNSQGHRVFGRNWLHLDPPRHLVLFTLGSLKHSLKQAGFEVTSRPKVSYSTQESFRASAAVAQGADPMNSPPPLPGNLRWRARIAEVRAWLQPEIAEELVLLARKPRA